MKNAFQSPRKINSLRNKIQQYFRFNFFSTYLHSNCTLFPRFMPRKRFKNKIRFSFFWLEEEGEKVFAQFLLARFSSPVYYCRGATVWHVVIFLLLFYLSTREHGSSLSPLCFKCVHDLWEGRWLNECAAQWDVVEAGRIISLLVRWAVMASHRARIPPPM